VHGLGNLLYTVAYTDDDGRSSGSVDKAISIRVIKIDAVRALDHVIITVPTPVYGVWMWLSHNKLFSF
jgi:hypothetical protein